MGRYSLRSSSSSSNKQELIPYSPNHDDYPFSSSDEEEEDDLRDEDYIEEEEEEYNNPPPPSQRQQQQQAELEEGEIFENPQEKENNTSRWNRLWRRHVNAPPTEHHHYDDDEEEKDSGDELLSYQPFSSSSNSRRRRGAPQSMPAPQPRNRGSQNNDYRCSDRMNYNYRYNDAHHSGYNDNNGSHEEQQDYYAPPPPNPCNQQQYHPPSNHQMMHYSNPSNNPSLYYPPPNNYTPPPQPKKSTLYQKFKIILALFFFLCIFGNNYMPPPPSPYISWSQPLQECIVTSITYGKKIVDLGLYVSFGWLHNVYQDMLMVEDNKDGEGLKDDFRMKYQYHNLMGGDDEKTMEVKEKQQQQEGKKELSTTTGYNFIPSLSFQSFTNYFLPAKAGIENDGDEAIFKMKEKTCALSLPNEMITYSNPNEALLYPPSSSASISNDLSPSKNHKTQTISASQDDDQTAQIISTFLNHHLIDQQMAVQHVTQSLLDYFSTSKEEKKDKNNLGMIFTGFEGTGKHRLSLLISRLLLHNCQQQQQQQQVKNEEQVCSIEQQGEKEEKCKILSEKDANKKNDFVLILDGNDYYHDDDDDYDDETEEIEEKNDMDDASKSPSYKLKKDIVNFLLLQKEDKKGIKGNIIILRHIEWMPPSVIAELVQILHHGDEDNDGNDNNDAVQKDRVFSYQQCQHEDLERNIVDEANIDQTAPSSSDCITHEVSIQNTIMIFTTQYGTKSLFEHLRQRQQQQQQDEQYAEEAELGQREMGQKMEQDIRNEIDLHFLESAGLNVGQLIDVIVPFQPLNPSSMKEILRQNLKQLSHQYATKQWKHLLVSENALDYLSGKNNHHVEYWTIRDPNAKEVVMTLSKRGAYDLVASSSDYYENYHDGNVDEGGESDNDGLVMHTLKTKIMGGLRERPDRITLIDFSAPARQFMIRWCKDDGEKEMMGEIQVEKMFENQERLCDDAYWFDCDV